MQAEWTEVDAPVNVSTRSTVNTYRAARAAFATYRADKAAHPLFIDRVRATY